MDKLHNNNSVEKNNNQMSQLLGAAWEDLKEKACIFEVCENEITEHTNRSEVNRT